MGIYVIQLADGWFSFSVSLCVEINSVGASRDKAGGGFSSPSG